MNRQSLPPGTSTLAGSEWTEPERAREWPAVRQQLPHIADAEAMLLGYLIAEPRRILDLGTGGGHLIALVRQRWPGVTAVGLDLSDQMLSAARARFAENPEIRLEVHDLMRPLPNEIGEFDVVLSSLAIHHLPDARKADLFAEIHHLLTEDGVFYDLDCVRSVSPELHALNQRAFGLDERGEDPSDQPASLADQLRWLQEAGFEEMDCFWKWMELALVGGTKNPRPRHPPEHQNAALTERDVKGEDRD